MYVLDTNVLSEIRKADADPNVVAWVRNQSDELLFTTAMNIYEIKKGILSIPSQDARQIRVFEVWLDRILERFSGRILPMGPESALAAAEAGKRTNIEMKDCVIGAIADHHRMSVVTRNVKHLSKIADRVIDPWTASADRG